MIRSGRPERHHPPVAAPSVLPVYDAAARLLGAHESGRRLVAQAAIRPGDVVIDVGTGTGSLPVFVKHAVPDAEVIGFDPDTSALALARRRAERHGVAVTFEVGFAGRLTVPDAGADRVLSSFVLHHVPASDQPAAAREWFRVLRPVGEVHPVDIVEPSVPVARLLRHRMRGGDQTDRVLTLLRDAGFSGTRLVGHRSTALGTLGFVRAVR